MARMTALLALCTVPDDVTAARVAHTLVDERLAACVNCVSGLRSTYRWQGAIHDEAETLLLIKTTSACVDALKSRLPQLHPYEVPELLVFDAADGLPAYLAWVQAQTDPHPSDP
jgi:periplasmic divalent cation tolerance protein